ncbi:hypothetical protein AB6A40_008871 [Gnathostoma spinigerum]|uniref:Uncharacterized protein n=1 Tax=Gnathostoma spinigerum TaxID=75299 RepID=A0ABD6EZN2_9BILA
MQWTLVITFGDFIECHIETLIRNKCWLCYGGVFERHEIPKCPRGARVMRRPDGMARKCLPHQNSLCINALPDQPNAQTVCCWYNQVDYYCCLDVSALECPDYHNVTVVVHHAYPQNPYALRSFHFRENLENELALLALPHYLNPSESFDQNDISVRRKFVN